MNLIHAFFIFVFAGAVGAAVAWVYWTFSRALPKLSAPIHDGLARWLRSTRGPLARRCGGFCFHFVSRRAAALLFPLAKTQRRKGFLKFQQGGGPSTNPPVRPVRRALGRRVV